MVQAISACPSTIAELLALVDKVETDEIRADELVDGLIDADVALDEPVLSDDEDAEEE